MEDIFEELAAVGSDDEGRADDHGGSGNRDDEAEEANDTKRTIKPKRVISRPQPKLDPARLLGPRGIFTIQSTFDKIKFKGKGHELDDLNNVLSRLQHWAHRLFPKLTFEDCIERIENLGNKREIMTNMHKIRNGMIDSDSGQPGQDNDDDDTNRVATPPPDIIDTFDQLVAAPVAAPTTLTDEQRARMVRNRLIAEERRMARQLAREKEKEEERLAASRSAGESGNTADTTLNSSQNTPVPSTTIASQSDKVELTSHLPDDVLDASKDSKTNEDSTRSAGVQNPSMELSTNIMETTAATTAGEEETRVICSASSSTANDAFAADDQKIERAETTAFDQSANNGTTMDDVAAGEETTVLCDNPSSTPESAAPTSLESRLEVSESDAMDIETPSEPKPAEKVGSADDQIVNYIPTGTITASLSETPKSIVDELMDVGSADDWEAAFAEEERALASQQNQP